MQIVYNSQMKDNQLRKNIANNIRQYRAKNRISQEVLMEKTGISQQYISNIENELVNPSIDILMKIAKALDVTLNDLVY